MEFNNSNNPINQSLVHYAGILGEFDYDPNIWICLQIAKT